MPRRVLWSQAAKIKLMKNPATEPVHFHPFPTLSDKMATNYSIEPILQDNPDRWVP